MTEAIPPNETVYVNNLEESIKIPQLKETLQELFEGYGTILDVIAHKNLKAKGQAYIVFSDVDSATRAIEEVNGFTLFNKPIRLSYARSKSDAIVKLRDGDEALEEHKKHRLKEKERKKELEQQQKSEQAKRVGGTLLSSSADGQNTHSSAPLSSSAVSGGLSKQGAGTGLKSTASSAAVLSDEFLPPNKILFLQDIPTDFQDADVLGGVFCQYPGFKEVRMVPGRGGIAFVEYEDEGGATLAKQGTSGLTLSEGAKPLRVTYQKQ